VLGGLAGFNLTTGDYNIDIGYNVVGVAGESNTIRIGNMTITDTYIRGIRGVTIASGAPVLVAANDQLGTMTSSKRFKDAIKPMDNASEALFGLKPATFHYKKEIDPKGTAQFGLVAEDVEKVNPDLVVRDKEGKPYSVRYDQVNAMLLNEFLKEHKKVEQQETTIAQLKKELEATTERQQKQIEALTAGLQKVSAQLELSKAAPHAVVTGE
jgi:trimeric autotransporter adhesin